MNNPQQPREYDAVLGGNIAPEGAAVLGGIEGVKLRLQNPDSKVRIFAVEQALNYRKQGLDLVIKALNDESWDVQDAAYVFLKSCTEARVREALRIFDTRFRFETVTVDTEGKIINRRKLHAKHFVEDLGNSVTLEMVEIPGGTFLMGIPEGERGEYHGNESPQHQVTVPGFFLGKYQLTQAQYQAIMGTNPSPNYHRDDHLPVEEVSWHNAVTFCQRLSQRTGRKYRLPSEAEWEYACRSGTTTPFHFGPTITSELANYDGRHFYGGGAKGIYRQQTIPVGSFGVANAFGLYDMHGNISEWCLDDWHNNYQGAPTDGSAWLDDNYISQQERRAVVRGGCWVSCPNFCRSAYRYYNLQNDLRSIVIGFRVACEISV